jgi:hypothetical protein
VIANGRGITLTVGMIGDAMFQRHSFLEALQNATFLRLPTRYFVTVVHIMLELVVFSMGEAGERD